MQPELFEKKNEKNLPSDHFTDTDLQNEWQKFLENLRVGDAVIYNAINGFNLRKKDEDDIEIRYPSELSKSEFEKVRDEFLNHFKHKVNHFKIGISYVKDEVNLKKEIVTKRSVFEKFAEINPLLKDLDDLMKFDFS